MVEDDDDPNAEEFAELLRRAFSDGNALAARREDTPADLVDHLDRQTPDRGEREPGVELIDARLARKHFDTILAHKPVLLAAVKALREINAVNGEFIVHYGFRDKTIEIGREIDRAANAIETIVKSNDLFAATKAARLVNEILRDAGE